MEKIKWNTETLPQLEDADSTCAKYYLVKVKGYAPLTMAMFLIDPDGGAGWYTSYYSKIVKEVEKWADVG